MSDSMTNQDLKPTRLLCTLKLLENFIEEFFYQNPISQLGLIVTYNKRAEKVSELAGNPRKHIENIKKLADTNCGGEPSLQNSLEQAILSLRHMPVHASREMLFIMGSLTTCDPGNIIDTINEAKNNKIRCSVIHLSAEIKISKELALKTGGEFGVMLDESHFKELLFAHLDPPQSQKAAEHSLIKMGFPCHAGTDNREASLGMCICHLDTGGNEGKSFSSTGYICPQCHCKYCELPVECRGCGLTLVSAPHLARSYHHLFPLQPFKEIPLNPEVENCFACQRNFSETKLKTMYTCGKCGKPMCHDCDIFIHETLHSCPGCSAQPPMAAQPDITNGHSL